MPVSNLRMSKFAVLWSIPPFPQTNFHLFLLRKNFLLSFPRVKASGHRVEIVATHELLHLVYRSLYSIFHCDFHSCLVFVVSIQIPCNIRFFPNFVFSSTSLGDLMPPPVVTFTLLLSRFALPWLCIASLKSSGPPLISSSAIAYFIPAFSPFWVSIFSRLLLRCFFKSFRYYVPISRES